MSATVNPTQLAALDQTLYTEIFEPIYAAEHTGEILAIEIQTKMAYLGKSGTEALKAGTAAHPGGSFHILRIGGGGSTN